MTITSPTQQMMHDFDVLLVNVCDVLAAGDGNYAVQFVNKFRATYGAYESLTPRLPVIDGTPPSIAAQYAASYVLDRLPGEAFFTETYPHFTLFEPWYRRACELILLHPLHQSLGLPAYDRVWTAHLKLVTFMESLLYAVSSRRTRALLAGITGSAAGELSAPTLASTTAK